MSGSWNTTTQTISWFHSQQKLKALDMDPKYQRDLVWPTGYKVFLIDTIICNLSIPKIYLESITNEDGDTKYKVADGKQRLNAIFAFTSNEFPLNSTKETKFDSKFDGCHFDDLPQVIKTSIWEYKLTVDELKGYSDSEMKEIFVRLNKNNERLSKQELRNATYSGDFIKLSEDLANEPYWQENKVIPPSGLRRMKDVEFVSELIQMMDRGIQNKTKTLDEYYSTHEEMNDVGSIKSKFLKVLNLIKLILPEIKATRFNQKGDFYSLFFVVDLLIKDGWRFDEMSIKKITNDLIEASESIALKINAPTMEMREYQNYSTQSSDSLKAREFRAKFIKNLIIKRLERKDTKRAFSAAQKKEIWHISKNKKCGICKKVVTSFDDYEPDHIKPWNAGGKTTTENGQVSHGACNSRKGDRVEK